MGHKVRVWGYAPKKSITDAVSEMKDKFDSGYWKDSCVGKRHPIIDRRRQAGSGGGSIAHRSG